MLSEIPFFGTAKNSISLNRLKPINIKKFESICCTTTYGFELFSIPYRLNTPSDCRSSAASRTGAMNFTITIYSFFLPNL